jgi:hypothetical protein
MGTKDGVMIAAYIFALATFVSGVVIGDFTARNEFEKRK